MMQRVLSILVTLAWALWFGGLLMLFIAVTSLFSTFERPIAGMGAAGIFRRFELYQLWLAAAALLATLAWRLLSGRSKLKAGVLALFAMTTILAITSTAVVSPRINLLQREGKSQTPEFRRLHGYSMMLYAGEAAILLIAGLLLPASIYQDRNSSARRKYAYPASPDDSATAGDKPRNAPVA